MKVRRTRRVAAATAFVAALACGFVGDASSNEAPWLGLFGGGTELRSDEFTALELDTGLWTYVDPVGDTTLAFDGSHAAISLPSGVLHELWTNLNQAPRLLQSAPDADFEVEARFDTSLDSRFQLLGIVVHADVEDLIRFEIHHDGNGPRLFTATMTDGVATGRSNSPIGDGGSIWLRVRRDGDTWTLLYSRDGSTWTVGASFDHALEVTAVGPYAGNSALPDETPPALEARIDYFRNVTVAPDNTAPPTVTGTAELGATLTADLGTWAGPSATLAPQWLRCDQSGANCAAIGGAVEDSYVLGTSDVGSTVRVQVTATNAGGSLTADSAPSAAVSGPPAAVVGPTIVGLPRRGETVTRSLGTWAGYPAPVLAASWQRCDAAGADCVDVPGATEESLLLGAADVGSTLRVHVVATNDEGVVEQSSVATPVVTAAPAATVAPVISGTARVGETLAAATGTWTGFPTPVLSIEWLRCDAAATCTLVAGATAMTYTLTADDISATMRVRVSGTNTVASSTALSAPTGSVQALPSSGGASGGGGTGASPIGTPISEPKSSAPAGPLVVARGPAAEVSLRLARTGAASSKVMRVMRKGRAARVSLLVSVSKAAALRLRLRDARSGRLVRLLRDSEMGTVTVRRPGTTVFGRVSAPTEALRITLRLDGRSLVRGRLYRLFLRASDDEGKSRMLQVRIRG